MLRPGQWANKQWEHLAAMENRTCLSCVKRVSLMIPLYLISAASKLLACVFYEPIRKVA